MPAHKHHILLADGDSDFLDLLRSAVGPSFRISTARTMNEVEAVIAHSEQNQSQISAVIMDPWMPGGLEKQIVAATRKALPRVPIIVLTAAFIDIHESDMLGQGATIFLEKPVSIRSLIRMAHEAIEGSSSQLRRHPRVAIEFEVIVRAHMQATELKARSANLAQGGMFLAMSPSLPLHEHIRLEFGLFNGTRVNIDAEIVWKRMSGGNDSMPDGVGVKFIQLPKDIEDHLAHWVGRQLITES